MKFKENLVAFKTLIIKEFLRFIRIWMQTILPPTITMTLYFLIFGNLIGSRIGEMAGVSYIDFIAPGLIMMAVITNSYSNTVSSFFQSKIFKNIEEMLISPMSNLVIIFGFVGGGVLRGLFVGFAVTLVSLFFTTISIYNFFIVISIILLTAILFSLAGFVNGVYAKKFDDVSIVPTFVLTPLTYLGGVFYSVSLLSGFWQMLSYLNPILYMVNAFRYGFLGISDINLLYSYLIIIFFIVILFVWAYVLLKKGAGVKK